MSYLTLDSLPRWLHCAGGRALEETEDAGPEPPPFLFDELPRKTELQARGKVNVARGVRVSLEEITGERGAVALLDTVFIVEREEEAYLEVWLPPLYGEAALKLATIAALMKYGLLQNFNETAVGTPDELYAFGQEVTEAAAVALSVRGDVAALSHLTSGAWCKACRSAYRCPELNKVVHERVFGELQAPDEPNVVPVPVRQRLAPGETVQEGLALAVSKIPMIEGWISAVRAQAGLAKSTKRRTKRARKKRGRPRSPAPAAPTSL